MAPWENYQVKRFDQYRVTTYPQFVFFKKSHIHTISAKHSKIKLSRPVHIIEVPKRKKKRIRLNIPRDNGQEFSRLCIRHS